MLNWKNASSGDLKRLRAAEMILARYPQIVDQIFNPSEPCLRNSAQSLMRGRSSGEKILIAISLDLWNGSAGSKVLDLDSLDDENLENVFSALKFMRAV
jgi:hypothetical protein